MKRKEIERTCKNRIGKESYKTFAGIEVKTISNKTI
jgi:hypothetical protein